jgi:predicted TIM-barrel fold metal-dependent hydrolase
MKSSSSKPANRRVAITYLLAGSAGILTGCIPFIKKKPQPICPNSPEVSYPSGPLTIDVHTHLFNGSDLPVKNFLSKVIVKEDSPVGAAAEILGDLLQRLAWTFAPDRQRELKMLHGLDGTLQACATKDRTDGVERQRQEAYQLARTQLINALEQSPQFAAELKLTREKKVPLVLTEAQMERLDVVGIIEALPVSVTEYRDRNQIELYQTKSRSGKSLRGMIRFLIQNFQYRYVTVHDYLHTFNEKNVRTVDLALAHMVDYDWWISGGEPTHTKLPEQVEVMEAISVSTGGRVHAFVPFDPLRKVAVDLGKDKGFDPLALVMDAIENRGCIGVKLYPPMGFAPYGNTAVQAEFGPHFWARDWLPSWMDRADMGLLLDGAMRGLLSWCEKEGVPVMAHTAESNGPAADFRKLALAKYWSIALKAFPALRVNFGHFGDTGPVEHGLGEARNFMRLMGESGDGKNAFADSAYFSEVLNEEPKMRAIVRKLYSESGQAGTSHLGNRFMYGTDWEMVLMHWPIEGYLSKFVELFARMETGSDRLTGTVPTRLSERFFGLNAATMLGLHQGERTRRRLGRFYARHQISTPEWMSKVDRPGA